ncbi:MAG: hypothetical protein R2764_11155 [Bacteroidales bacterium]
MKKTQMVFCLMICAKLLLAQATATLSLIDIPVSQVGEEVLVTITVDDISDDIFGFQISIETDDNYLSWNGTNDDPAPGVAYLHPNLPSLGVEWVWNNSNLNELFFQLTPAYQLISIEPNEVLMILSYTYNGGLAFPGSSPITFGVDKVYGEGLNPLSKGMTQFYDVYFNFFELTLINGSVYTLVLTPQNKLETIRVWSDRGDIYIQSPALFGEIEIFNLMGQEVKKQSMLPGINEIQIHYSNSLYVVSVLSNDLYITRKVLVY